MKIKIENIIDSILQKRIKITNHAYDEAEIDNLTFDEIFYSILNGKIIEIYERDKPYPSCLIYGNNFKGEPIHSIFAYNHMSKWSVLITVYRPDPTKWINWEKRRK